MKLKKFAMAALISALTVSGAMTSLAAGWTRTGGGWKYQTDDGAYAQNRWVIHKNHWYYLGEDGLMSKGWQKIDGKWYFFANTGQMINGLIKVDGRVYYMDGTRGHRYTGPRSIGGRMYYFSEEGLAGEDAPYVYEEWSGNGDPIRAFPIRS